MKDWANRMDWTLCHRWTGGKWLYVRTFCCRAVRVRFFGWKS